MTCVYKSKIIKKYNVKNEGGARWTVKTIMVEQD